MIKKLEKRYESEKYEKALNIACAGAIGLSVASIGITIKPIIDSISKMGLLGLIFTCEQECENDFLSGITEFAESDDLDACLKPFLDGLSGKTVKNKDCEIFYQVWKKWFN